MARQSRTKRGDYQAPAPSSSASTRNRRQVRPVEEPKSQTGRKKEREGGLRAFTGETVAELKKTEWPGRRQVFSATVVVIVAVAVVGAYLWILDETFSRFVRDVLLNL